MTFHESSARQHRLFFCFVPPPIFHLAGPQHLTDSPLPFILHRPAISVRKWVVALFAIITPVNNDDESQCTWLHKTSHASKTRGHRLRCYSINRRSSITCRAVDVDANFDSSALRNRNDVAEQSHRPSWIPCKDFGRLQLRQTAVPFSRAFRSALS